MNPGEWITLLFLGLAAGSIAAIVGNLVYLMVWKWPKEDGKVPFARFRREPKIVDMAHLASKEEKQFCSACGSRKIVWRFQSGFNPDNGQPQHVSYLACPDWDEVSWSAAYHRQVASSPFGPFGPPPRDCENTVITSMAALVVHLGHADGDVSVNCKRCIIDMERAGIITHDDADHRLKEIA